MLTLRRTVCQCDSDMNTDLLDTGGLGHCEVLQVREPDTEKANAKGELLFQEFKRNLKSARCVIVPPTGRISSLVSMCFLVENARVFAEQVSFCGAPSRLEASSGNIHS